MTEQEIKKIVEQAESVSLKRLRPINNLIADIKNALQKGTDAIPTSTIQEWAVVTSVLMQEIIPAKEAYRLTQTLWDIEIKKAGAKNLLELERKKVDIAQINVIAGTEGQIKKSISRYMQEIMGMTYDSLSTLSFTLRKILDTRG